MTIFLNSFLDFGPSFGVQDDLGPRFGAHDSFTILSFLIVSIVLIIEVLLFIYSLMTFSKTLILCPFSVKTFIKNIY